MQNIQEQLLLTVSAETFSDPSNCEKLNLLSKEKGIQEIMKNTVVDKDNNKVLFKYLYTEKLIKLSVVCQLYYPVGLASPIMFPIRALLSEI